MNEYAPLLLAPISALWLGWKPHLSSRDEEIGRLSEHRIHAGHCSQLYEILTQTSQQPSGIEIIIHVFQMRKPKL